MEDFYSRDGNLKPLKPFEVGDYSARCVGTWFQINKGGENHGIKLVGGAYEGLEKIVFDLEKKTVSVVIKKPTLPPNAPRILDLTEAPDFFDGLRENIETILTTQHAKFKTVTPNEDRTVFTISE